jgi:putative ABC transport system permease protein
MNIPIRKGRSFTEFDVPPAPPVVIVNETMARQFWPNEDPLGQRLRISSGPLLTVAGVVGDVRHSGLNYEPNSEMFLPHTQAPQVSMAVMVRTSNDPLPLAAAVRDQIKELDKDLPAPITTMDQLFSDSVAAQRFNALLLSIFGALALGLAIVGIFGVINYSVAQRTHELGVRIALGAQRRDIFRLVIGQGLVLALLGVGIGLAGAFALTGLISDLLYDVTPTDPGTFVVVSLLLTAVALLACYLPARRATQVDPIEALRCE